MPRLPTEARAAGNLHKACRDKIESLGQTATKKGKHVKVKTKVEETVERFPGRSRFHVRQRQQSGLWAKERQPQWLLRTPFALLSPGESDPQQSLCDIYRQVSILGQGYCTGIRMVRGRFLRSDGIHFKAKVAEMHFKACIKVLR